MNPLYKDVRGKTILDFYSEYDLNMLGVSLKDVHTDTDTDDWGKVWGLYDSAKTIEDKDLEEAAEKLAIHMRDVEGYGQE